MNQNLQVDGLSAATGLDLLRQMWEIRLFEDRVYDLLGRNVIKGASHLYAGEEAVAVGAISVLRDDDLITSTHRGHGHCHARGAAIAKTEEAKQEHYERMMAELCGRETGYCLGRGGSMHIADVEKGNLGATGIVGGNIPVATGAALALRLRSGEAQQDNGRVVLCFFGDGAAQTGNFHESLNMAGLWGLPVVYVIENNLYGMSVPIGHAAARGGASWSARRTAGTATPAPTRASTARATKRPRGRPATPSQALPAGWWTAGCAPRTRSTPSRPGPKRPSNAPQSSP